MKKTPSAKKCILMMSPHSCMNTQQQAFFSRLLQHERAEQLTLIDELKRQLLPVMKRV